MKRPSWKEFWFLIALMYSTRGTCDRLRTATVLVDKRNRMISAGYNGSVSGMPHCDEMGHLIIEGHCERNLHGEQNAVNNALNLERLRGASAYILATPCLPCVRLLIENGVKHIYYTGEYSNARGKEYIEELARAKSVVLEGIHLDLQKLLDDAVVILESKGGALFDRSGSV